MQHERITVSPDAKKVLAGLAASMRADDVRKADNIRRASNLPARRVGTGPRVAR